ncbi:hypothetical protein PRUB_a2498 [Pseudoalteromonas rubra]|uniref:Uncharacterized protein n=1 Tax=Pseudoalteromonas rubra TaxID=43658 RepID=A0A8T0CB98_9GAMM|nr:hypothetical protein PRUB_a2498 [Pseudoalteromonas rubra]
MGEQKKRLSISFFANCGAKSSFSLVFAQGEMSHFDYC